MTGAPDGITATVQAGSLLSGFVIAGFNHDLDGPVAIHLGTGSNTASGKLVVIRPLVGGTPPGGNLLLELLLNYVDSFTIPLDVRLQEKSFATNGDENVLTLDLDVDARSKSQSRFMVIVESGSLTIDAFEDGYNAERACGSDSDGDGVGDVCDDCPNDPNKTSPGDCGCGIPETPNCGGGILEYDEDFSSDPGWITDQPAEYFWDSGTQTYHATTQNAQPGNAPTRYAYRPIEYDGHSLRLEFDLQPTDLQWSAGVAFGLFDENLAIVDISNVDPPDVHYLHAHPGRSDGGRTIGLYVRGENGVGQVANIGWNLISDGAWYHCVLEYDSAADTATLTVTQRDTGILVDAVEIGGIGGLPVDLDYLGFARDPVGDCCPPMGPGCSGFSCSREATAYIDNVQLSEVPS